MLVRDLLFLSQLTTTSIYTENSFLRILNGEKLYRLETMQLKNIKSFV